MELNAVNAIVENVMNSNVRSSVAENPGRLNFPVEKAVLERGSDVQVKHHKQQKKAVMNEAEKGSD